MTQNMEESIYVNGPTNVFRMEGNINGEKKIIYLFADVHLDANNQTQCESIRAIEIKDYLLKNFEKLKEDDKIDFFLEIQPSYIKTQKHNYRDNYFLSMRYFFMKSFNFDVKKNKIYTSTILPNVRFHYMDIRTLISFDSHIFYPTSELNDFINYYEKNNLYISKYAIYKCIDIIKKIHENITYINETLFMSSTKIDININTNAGDNKHDISGGDATKSTQQNPEEQKLEEHEHKYSPEYKFNRNTANKILNKMYNANDKKIREKLEEINIKYIGPKILECLTYQQKIINLLQKYMKFEPTPHLKTIRLQIKILKNVR